MNLPMGRTWSAVILPQAIRRWSPALGNYVISMLKDTPLLMAITVLEMLGERTAVLAAELPVHRALTVIGVAFIVISYLASLALRALERRLAHATLSPIPRRPRARLRRADTPEQVTKRFGENTVLDHLDFSVDAGKHVT